MSKFERLIFLPIALFATGCSALSHNMSWNNHVGTSYSSNSNFPTIEGSGKVKSEARKAKNFTSITLKGTGKVALEQTGKESVSVTADDNLLPYLTAEIKNGGLVLGIKDDTNFNTKNEITYHVSVKNLKALEISGSGDIDAKKIKTDKLKVVLSGSGSVVMEGEAGSQEIVVSGSGSFDGENLKGKTSKIDIAGSGSVVINASEKLNANISGTGSVEYLGAPNIFQDVSGSGSIGRK